MAVGDLDGMDAEQLGQARGMLWAQHNEQRLQLSASQVVEAEPLCFMALMTDSALQAHTIAHTVANQAPVGSQDEDDALGGPVVAPVAADQQPAPPPGGLPNTEVRQRRA